MFLYRYPGHADFISFFLFFFITHHFFNSPSLPINIISTHTYFKVKNIFNSCIMHLIVCTRQKNEEVEKLIK